MSELEPGRLIGSGKEAEVFEYGREVLKLYRLGIAKRSAFREAAILAIIEAFDVPAPRTLGVRTVGERWGVIMTRADGPSFAEAMGGRTEALPVYMKAMVRLQLAIHRHEAVLLPDLKPRLMDRIRRATILGAARQGRLLDRLADMPAGDRLCHGDFHPFNVMGEPDNACIVDWLDATRGEPAADACRSYLLMRGVEPTWASAYLDAYATESGLSPNDILGWLPILAAARLAEDVPSETEALMAIVDGASA
jgi:aminoglycoside phosphotransferase (APT) family kinase protein